MAFQSKTNPDKTFGNIFVQRRYDAEHEKDVPSTGPLVQPGLDTPREDKVSGDVDPAGLLETGNIQLSGRPKVKNPDGGTSTVYSTSFGDDEGREILVPRAADGKILSEKQAEQRYHRTGEHLGIFDSPENADAYAQKLHEAYERGDYEK